MIYIEQNNIERNSAEKNPEKKSEKKHLFFRYFIIIISVLIVLRIFLPIVALRVINNKLASLPNYICIVHGFDISILNKSITLKNIEMKKRNGKIDVPLFTSNDIYVHLESYKARTSKVVVDSCRLNLVKGKNDETSQLWVDKELIELLANMPLKQNILIVKNADVHFIEKHPSANIDVSIKSMNIEAKNIENENNSTAKYPSSILIKGNFEGGKLNIRANLNKQKKDPMMHIVASFSPIQVSKIKNFLKVYADLKVDSGILSASSTFNIYNGRIDGFIDPIAKNLEFHKSSKESEVQLIDRIKERSLNVASKLLGKGESEKIVTRIELHGPLSEVKVNVWDIIQEGLKRSFTNEKKED